MSNGWLDGMGTFAGILLGVAIPAQEAMRARKAIGAHLAERVHEITDAFDVAGALAQQALSALSGPVRERVHFAAGYNRAYIEHLLRRVDVAANNAVKDVPKDAIAFVNAASHARSSMRDFFDNLTAANLTTFLQPALLTLFDRLASDLRELHIAGDRMLESRHAGMSAIGMCRALWNTR
jgi:ABC-type transporter Mla subunit MlaD